MYAFQMKIKEEPSSPQISVILKFNTKTTDLHFKRPGCVEIPNL